MDEQAKGQWAVIRDPTEWEAFCALAKATVGKEGMLHRSEPREFPCLVGLTWVTARAGRQMAWPAFIYTQDARKLLAAVDEPPLIVARKPAS